MDVIMEDTEIIKDSAKFKPDVPQSLEETELPETFIEELVLKILLAKGVLSGREMAEEMHMPFKIISPILADMKNRQFITHRTTASLGDFIYHLSDMGKEAAQVAKDTTSYIGPAPVIYDHYVRSVYHQSIRNEQPGMEALKKAYSDIVLTDDVLNTIGPAVNSGRGIFLFGEPGNGKTIIAERIRDCFSEDIYIPRTLWIEGELVQLYDPQNHEEVPVDVNDKYDRRWIKIRRPTVIVGGELTLDALEIQFNPISKISEAPFQMKANCGTFMIDDFGRQRVNHTDLLNRWIVPLEKHYDFQLLPNGRKIEVPFDQLIVFSTNLDPQDLADDAFLRRIPYKIEIKNPELGLFKDIFLYQCDKYGIPFDEEMFQYLLDNHYKGRRPFRACHPRDILDQVINYSVYKEMEPRMTPETLDEACRNYFAAMRMEEEILS